MNLANFKPSGNPDQKSNIGFLIFMVKHLETCIFIFRVPKKCMSGLPYLRRISMDFFSNWCHLML